MSDPKLNESAVPKPSKGLRQRELCESLGMNYRDVARTARELGCSTHAYVQEQTGWQLHEELYYPPGAELPPSTLNNKP
ncbi:MAG: hypothetical protein ACFB9N_08210 [Geitlerinemataceae cyanobacterium]